jgi:hypothetical protein
MSQHRITESEKGRGSLLDRRATHAFLAQSPRSVNSDSESDVEDNDKEVPLPPPHDKQKPIGGISTFSGPDSRSPPRFIELPVCLQDTS